MLFQAQVNIGKSTPLQWGDINWRQVKITGSAASKLRYVSNNPYIKL